MVGNPSDGFFGKTVACLIKNYYATTTLIPNSVASDQSIFYVPSSVLDSIILPTALAGLTWIKKTGYDGVHRLFLAVLHVFVKYAQDMGFSLAKQGFKVIVKTNIPRQVGLAGSSALIVAFLHTFIQFYNIEIPLHKQAALALAAEAEELGVSAGHQDRVVQTHGGLIFMNFDKLLMEGRGYGDYVQMDTALMPKCWLGSLNYLQ